MNEKLEELLADLREVHRRLGSLPPPDNNEPEMMWRRFAARDIYHATDAIKAAIQSSARPARQLPAVAASQGPAATPGDEPDHDHPPRHDADFGA